MKKIYRLHFAPDNASLIVRLALEELGQPFACVLVDRSVEEQKSDAYRRLHPNGLIPVLETPDGPIFETAAILLWLSDRHGGLAPAPDSTERAAFLKWLFFLSNTLHPALRMIFYPDRYVGQGRDAQTRLKAHMRGEIARYLDMIEAEIAAGHRWMAGAEPSALDLYLAPMLRWIALYPAPRGGAGWFRLDGWPRLHAVCLTLEGRDSVRRAAAAEGLGPAPFTAPRYPDPPVGSAT